VLEDALMHDHKLTVEARVDLEILRRLHADSCEELIVESVDWHLHFFCVGHLCVVFIEYLLPIVNDEALAEDPE